MHRYSAKLLLGAHAAAGVSASAGLARPGESRGGKAGLVRTAAEAGGIGSTAATAEGAVDVRSGGPIGAGEGSGAGVTTIELAAASRSGNGRAPEALELLPTGRGGGA